MLLGTKFRHGRLESGELSLVHARSKLSISSSLDSLMFADKIQLNVQSQASETTASSVSSSSNNLHPSSALSPESLLSKSPSRCARQCSPIQTGLSRSVELRHSDQQHSPISPYDDDSKSQASCHSTSSSAIHSFANLRVSSDSYQVCE